MRISRIEISNYRCIKAIDLRVEPYTAFVGANGSGKSSVLYALDWFFSGGPLEPSDVHGYSEVATGNVTETDRVVEVTVTFEDLTDRDRDRLERYGRGRTATFKRSWKVGSEKDKIVGNALQGPGFAEIRNMKLVGEFRPAYKSLRDSLLELPDLGNSPSKDQVIEALAAWESAPDNVAKLMAIDADDASHMFGIGGTPIIRQCVRMVLVPAATDISNEVGGVTKGSTLNELIGALMANASAEAKQAWINKNATVIDELTDSMRASVEKSAGLQSSRVNEKLTNLVPNASVDFTPTVPDWVPTPVARVQTDVTIDGLTNDVSRQGHGIQRAVLIAMLHALVPDAQLVRQGHCVQEGETEAEAEARLACALEDLPGTLICIEEPEIYQHPIRARTFARVLAGLAQQPNVQVIIATHSPCFTRPDQFAGIRRFTLRSREARVDATSIAEVATAAGCREEQVKKIVEKRLPTTFAEGFFADAIVLLEGGTDLVVLDAIAERQQRPFDCVGISLLEVSGKESLAIPHFMMNALGVPTYLVADGDALGAGRKHPRPEDVQKRTGAHASHKKSTEDLLGWLPTSDARAGSLPFGFGDPTVICNHYSIWEDDIETELEKWPSFVGALASNGYAVRDKDLMAYRAGVMEADLADMPACLNEVVDAIHAFRTIQ